MDEQTLIQYLNTYFSYNHFRTGQLDIIQSVLEKQDTLAILPTGTGKSICYQLPALILEGTTIIISPLISLMLDQVKELKAKQIKDVVAVTSFMSFSERKEVFSKLSSYKMIFMSPELLQHSSVLKKLKELNVSLFVIDEAHCISQWGHAFRPDYLRLEKVIQLLQNPPILALSATAPPKIQEDIETALHRKKMKRFIFPMDRPNIGLFVQKLESTNEKNEALLQITSTYDVPTLIYFSSRNQAEEISYLLSNALTNRRIAFYHGGMEQSDRITVQQQFMNNQIDIICCTSAFGMGINKNNIRLVIHYHFPGQLESYIQEFGRAGRDGNQSISVVLHMPFDDALPRYFVEQELPTEEVITEVIHYLQTSGLHFLPKEVVDLIREKWSINEVQWRFLLYQLEIHGMIKEDRIVEQKEYAQRSASIIQFQSNRLFEQYHNIEMSQKWLEGTTCLRSKLYRNYQDSFTSVENLCCSNCHPDTKDWNLKSPKKQSTNPVHWQKRLQQLLKIEGYHETK